jgi:hypothetical protein
MISGNSVAQRSLFERCATDGGTTIFRPALVVARDRKRRRRGQRPSAIAVAATPK